METERGWSVDTTQLLKGVLDLAVLAVVRREDAYGYDIVRRLREAGLDDVGDASVYGTLRRLFQAGALTSYMVASDEGPHRRYYGLNRAGEARFQSSVKTWREFAVTLERVLNADQEERA
jgi:PadR family transcriptional regulator PadR